MMELLWTPEAAQDRDEIYDYIEADNPAAALALEQLIIPTLVGLVAAQARRMSELLYHYHCVSAVSAPPCSIV